MKLKNFVERYVCRNTLIRLWEPCVNGYKMIFREDLTKPNNIDEVCMEWELLQRKHWLSDYLYRDVVGVTDIVVQGPYSEAINIVIKPA